MTLSTPTPTATDWVELGPRGEVRDWMRRLLRVTPELHFDVLAMGSRHLGRAYRTSEKAWGARPPGSAPVSLLSLALEARPHPAPTPPMSALLVSGGALLAVAKVQRSQTLGVRTFGHGAARYALVERSTGLPAAILRRPDVTRLWVAAPGVYCECGFEPVFPPHVISRWLEGGEMAVFRRRGGNLRTRGATPLSEGVPLVALRAPPGNRATAPDGFLPFALEVGGGEPARPRGVLIEKNTLPSFRRWTIRAPRPLLDGLVCYFDQRFWLLLVSDDTLVPPIGKPLQSIDEGARQVVFDSAFKVQPRMPPSVFLDAVGARPNEVVLLRQGSGSGPDATAIARDLFVPLDRRAARREA